MAPGRRISTISRIRLPTCHNRSGQAQGVDRGRKAVFPRLHLILLLFCLFRPPPIFGHDVDQLARCHPLHIVEAELGRRHQDDFCVGDRINGGDPDTASDPAHFEQDFRKVKAFVGHVPAPAFISGLSEKYKPPAEREQRLHIAAVLAAGCDLVLHCSGDTAEMEAVAAGAGPITDKGLARLQNGAAMLNTPGDIGGDIDAAAVQARLDEIMNAEGGA